MNVMYEITASVSGTPMTLVPAMLRPGMMPVMFIVKIMKNIVVSSGRNRLPSTLPRRSSAMLTRTKSRAISTRLWNRPGTTRMLRVPIQNTAIRTTTAKRRISMIRFMSNPVPSNRTMSGKNSVIDGPWKVPSSVEV